MNETRLSEEIQLSVVLACYCDAPHLERNVGVLTDYLALTKIRYEIILVEDGSPDDTLAEVRKVAADLDRRGITVQKIEHGTNKGRGAAVQSGFLAARGDVVCYIDVDLEHRPDAMVSMYMRIRDGQCDGIVAKRLYESTKVSLLRLILSRGYRALVRLFVKLPVTDTEAGFKMFRRSSVLPILPEMEDQRWFWDTEIVARADAAGLRLVDHPIVFVRDPFKKSTVKVVSDSIDYLICLVRWSRRTSLKPLTQAVGVPMALSDRSAGVE